MRHLWLDKLPLTARAGLAAVTLLAVVLVSMWALRYAANLPAFLPLNRGDGGAALWQLFLGLAIVILAFGVPLFFLVLRNGQLKAAKQALRAGKAEFRAYAEAGSDRLWATDADCRLTALAGGRSPAFEAERRRLIGLTLEEAIAAQQFTTDAPRLRQLYDDIAAHRPFRNVDVRVRDGHGRIRHLSLSAVPTYDDDGAFAGYRGVTADITERKEAEIGLRESEARFADFASSASDWFWETDTEHRFTFNSSKIRDTLGISTTYATGKTRFELASEEDLSRRPGAWERLRDDLDNHRPFRNFEYESIINGERRTILTSGVPVFDADGRFAGYRGSATDVTEHRRAEREAIEYLRQFRMLADNLPILIANFDADYRFIYVNHTGEVWFDRPREEILGRTFAEVAGKELDATSIPTRQLVLAGETVRQETVTQYPDGITRTVQRTMLPDFQPGEPPRIHVMAIDVTEQRQLEEQVRQNLKMEALGNLTGGVAHDFNNLLLAIQGNLEFLREEPLDDSVKPFVENALRGVDRAADLTRRLLAFSRRQPLAPRSVDIRSLVSDMDGLLRRTLESYVDITIDVGDEPAIALVDPGQLENALLNLAINARDAMPDGGALAVRVRRVTAAPPADEDHATVGAPPASYVCIEVEDNGAGMSESVRDHAFEPFFTTKRIGHGTGLGLAMVHGFVTQSGGFAEIDSEPGAGTTIRLHLPATDAVEEPVPAAAAPAVPISSGAAALLVEDNEMVRAVAERYLTELGYRVQAVATPADAMAVLEGPKPVDLLLSDLGIAGGIDGLDLAERARSLWPAMNMVLMSGYADLAGNNDRAQRLNARLIAKPFSRATLAEAIVAARPPEESDAPPTPLRAAG